MDLAGLGTSIEDGLMNTELDSDGNVLSSHPWSFTLQPVREEMISSESLNTYMNEHMHFQEDSVVTQDQLETIASTASADHTSTSMLHLPPLELDAETMISHLVPSQSPQEDPLTSEDHDLSFEQSSYFHEASISDSEVHPEDEPTVQPMVESLASSRLIELSSNIDNVTHSAVKEPVDISQLDGFMSSNPIVVADDDYDDLSEASSPASASLEAEDHSKTYSKTDPPPTDAIMVPNKPLVGGDTIYNKDKAADLLKALKENGDLAGLLESIGYHPHPQLPEVDKNPTRPQLAFARATFTRTEQSKNVHVCTIRTCGKSFPRACELKKHMKRHEKPYGCTFPRCTKRFGSKNDWKRHENSQHYHHELWKCNAANLTASPTDPNTTTPCNRTYNRREQFRAHLKKDHGMVDSAAVESKIEECLDVRSYEVRFWCGFCCKVVQIRERGLKAGMERFNHMDSHFTGAEGRPKMKISQWQDAEPGLPVLDVVMLPEEGSEESERTKCSPTAASQKRGLTDEESQRGRPAKRQRAPVFWTCVSLTATPAPLHPLFAAN